MWWKICLRYMFSHVGLFFVVCSYCVMGTLLFQAIELQNETTLQTAAQQAAKSIDDARQEMAEMIVNITSYPNAGPDMIKSWLDQYQAMIIDARSKFGNMYDGTYHADLNLGWSFPSGLLFTVSTVLAIGYGNVTPKTELGRFVLIIYSLFGVPLTLMFLANIGKTFAWVVRMAYARGCCFFFHKKRRQNYKKSKENQFLDNQNLDYVNNGEFRERSNTEDSISYIQEAHLVIGMKVPVVVEQEHIIFVPIMLTLGILFLYTFLGTLLFNWWEGWTILQSSYFNVVSLMTIGFGDFVPGWSSARTGMGKFKLVFGALYLLIGLAVISMGLNLIVEEIIEASRKAGKKMGILDANHGLDTKKKSNLEAAIRRSVPRP